MPCQDDVFGLFQGRQKPFIVHKGPSLEIGEFALVAVHELLVSMLRNPITGKGAILWHLRCCLDMFGV